MEDLPQEGGDPLGSTSDVRDVLLRTHPGLDLTDPTWAILEDAEYSIEFSIGKDEPCTTVMLHVRGSDNAIQPIRSVCNATGWGAFDCSDGELIDFGGDPARGLRAWRAYRERSGAPGPLKGISMPTANGSRVFFDALQPKASAPAPKPKPWWKVW